jgi:hypothetical protein
MLEIYTAGFLDADGSVSLQKGRSTDPNYMRTPEVSFYNCDRTILDAISARWGGKVKSNKPTSEKHNVSFCLKVGGDAALRLLKEVVPYMLHQKKSLRAKLIVEHYKDCTPRNGKYTPDLIERKTWLVEEVMGMTMRGVGAW